MKSAYKRLGVAEDATPADIENAYRQARERHANLVREHGPDVADDFDAIVTAYNVLRDKASREAHDRYLNTDYPPLVVEYDEHRPVRRAVWLWAGTIVVAVALGASGYYVQARNAQERAAEAEAELAKMRLEKQEAERLRVEEVAKAEQARREAEERRFALESQAIADKAKREREEKEQDSAMLRKMDSCGRGYGGNIC